MDAYYTQQVRFLIILVQKNYHLTICPICHKR